MKRLWRVGKWVLSGLAALVLLLAAAVWALTGTEKGARRALSFGAGLAGYELQWSELRGTLWTGLSFRELQLSGPALMLSVQDGGFRWQPARLLGAQREAYVERLWLHGAELELPAADEAVEQEPSEPLQASELEELIAGLPLRLRVDELSLQDLQFRQGETALSLDTLQLALQAGPEGATLQLGQLALMDAEVAGQLALLANLDVDATLDWRYHMEPELAGRLTLGGNLRELSLEHLFQTPLAATSRGTVVPGIFADAPLSLALRHELARLDLADFGVEDVLIENLQLDTTGGLEALRLTAAVGAINALQFAPASLELAVLYDGANVVLESLELASTELQLGLSGSYAIEAQRAELDWELRDLTPGEWLPAVKLAGLSGSGRIALTHDEAGVDADLAVGPLSGTLNTYPLDLVGSIVLRDSQPDAVDLQLASGVNTVVLSGSLQPLLDLDWSLDISEPAQLWEGLGGVLQGSGRLEGEMSLPVMGGALQGSGLSLAWQDSSYRLASVTLDATAFGVDAENNAVALRLAGLVVEQGGTEPATWIDSLALDLRGNPAAHVLQLQARGFDSTLQLALDGELQDEDWTGNLLQAELDSPWGRLQLAEPLRLAFGSAGMELPRHCWSLVPMSLCLQAVQPANGALDAALSLSGLPLDWLNAGSSDAARPPALPALLQQYGALLPANIVVAGTAGLDASISGFADGSWRDLQASLVLADTRLRVRLEQDESEAEEDAGMAPVTIALHEPALRVSGNGSAWHAELDLAVEQLAEGEVPADQPLVPRSTVSAVFDMDAAENLDGSLRLDFPALDWVQAFVPLLEDPGGRASGNVRIGGTLSEPLFDAGFSLVEGHFRVPEYGLEVQSFEVGIDARPEQASLHVDLRDAEGSLQLDAVMREPLDDSRMLEASLAGAGFTLMDNDAAHVTVSPDLQLSWSGSGLHVGGSFLVPLADVALEEWVSNVGGGVSPSRDAVVVVEDPDALVAESGTVLPFTAQLQLALGDAVRIHGFGLEARLGGELQVQQEAQRPLLVYGELSLPEGSYEIYNQALQMRDGRLLFFGNPLDPVVDLRAFRETPNAEVGLQLGGNVTALQSSLYSTPQLPEAEILSLLITGKSFRDTNAGDNDALVNAVANFGIERTAGLTSLIGDTLGLDDVSISGGSSYLDSSLGMGKYLSPDLLMRYEIGLFGRQAVFSLIYSLSERLKLEVRSGLSQSVDISYAVEKD